MYHYRTVSNAHHQHQTQADNTHIFRPQQKQTGVKKKNGDNNFDPLVKFVIYMFGYRNISFRVSVIRSS